MISSFTLKFGRTPGTPGEQIAAVPVTVFVGPNNSGKSRILSEIALYCRTGYKDAGNLILEDVTFSGFDPDSAERAIEHIRQPPNPGETIQVGHIIVASLNSRQHVDHTSILQAVKRPADNSMLFCQSFLIHHILILDGRSRINLANDQPAGDLQRPPQSCLQVLFRDKTKLDEVRRIVFDAFGTYFVIDPTGLGQLRVRLASRPPQDVLEEQGILQPLSAFTLRHDRLLWKAMV